MNCVLWARGFSQPAGQHVGPGPSQARCAGPAPQTGEGGLAVITPPLGRLPEAGRRPNRIAMFKQGLTLASFLLHHPRLGWGWLSKTEATATLPLRSQARTSLQSLGSKPALLPPAGLSKRNGPGAWCPIQSYWAFLPHPQSVLPAPSCTCFSVTE